MNRFLTLYCSEPASRYTPIRVMGAYTCESKLVYSWITLRRSNFPSTFRYFSVSLRRAVKGRDSQSLAYECTVVRAGVCSSPLTWSLCSLRTRLSFSVCFLLLRGEHSHSNYSGSASWATLVVLTRGAQAASR